jgi:hypothetical protein
MATAAPRRAAAGEAMPPAQAGAALRQKTTAKITTKSSNASSRTAGTASKPGMIGCPR